MREIAVIMRIPHVPTVVQMMPSLEKETQELMRKMATVTEIYEIIVAKVDL